MWLDTRAQREDTLLAHLPQGRLPLARAAQILPEVNAIPGIRAHCDEACLCAALSLQLRPDAPRSKRRSPKPSAR